MTEEISYAYTDRNLLEEPETYEYSETHGRPFLDAYREDRRRALREVGAGKRHDGEPGARERWQGLLDAVPGTHPDVPLPRLEQHPAVSQLLTRDERTQPSGQADVTSDPRSQSGATGGKTETVAVLVELVGYPRRAPADETVMRDWLDRLSARFEVKKQLFNRYNDEMRPVDEEPAPLVTYPLFALALLVSHERESNLRYLNAALKVGDVVVSTLDDQRATTRALTALVLRAEQAAVESLARSSGVPL